MMYCLRERRVLEESSEDHAVWLFLDGARISADLIWIREDHDRQVLIQLSDTEEFQKP